LNVFTVLSDKDNVAFLNIEKCKKSMPVTRSCRARSLSTFVVASIFTILKKVEALNSIIN